MTMMMMMMKVRLRQNVQTSFIRLNYDNGAKYSQSLSPHSFCLLQFASFPPDGGSVFWGYGAPWIGLNQIGFASDDSDRPRLLLYAWLSPISNHSPISIPHPVDIRSHFPFPFPSPPLHYPICSLSTLASRLCWKVTYLYNSATVCINSGSDRRRSHALRL